jgi:hypothetical protein
MAEFIVRHSLNPYKAVKFGVTTRQVTPVGEEGEPVWVMEVATDEPNASGVAIRSEYIHNVSYESLDEEIQRAIARMSAQIDWSPFIEDQRGPTIYYSNISDGDQNVGIENSLYLILKDILPAAGIDPDSIEMTVNGFDVTNELQITGDPYEYNIVWSPYVRLYEQV